jgi:hypothetical protein
MTPIGGFLPALNVASHVLNNQPTIPVQSVAVQKPVSGMYWHSQHQIVLHIPNFTRSKLLLIFLTYVLFVKTYYRYKLTFFAMDGTVKTEFCFDSVAKRIVGKPCEALLRSMDISGNTPLELTAIVGLKFTFTINININSFYSAAKIFNIDSILETHGRQESIPHVKQITEYEDPLTPDEHSPPHATKDSAATVSKKLLSSSSSLVRIESTYN